MRFFSTYWSDCRNWSTWIKGTSDEWNKHERWKSNLPDRFADVTLGMTYPIIMQWSLDKWKFKS
jgi:hypothetical protein